MIIGIDPGQHQSGIVELADCGRVENAAIFPNEHILELLYGNSLSDICVIEMVASYGMPVGAEVFETVGWIGRFETAWAWRKYPTELEWPERVFRKDIKIHFCGSMRAKDPNVRQALIDTYPPTGGGSVPQVGTKKQPGPLYGLKSHMWSALAVARFWLDTRAQVAQ